MVIHRAFGTFVIVSGCNWSGPQATSPIPSARYTRLRAVRTIGEIQDGFNLRRTASYEEEDHGALHKRNLSKLGVEPTDHLKIWGQLEF